VYTYGEVENTFVWILETVCREMDAEAEAEAEEETRDRAHDGGGDGGKFSILLDLSTCPHVKQSAFFSIGMLLKRAVKKGFRGRLNRFYIYPAGLVRVESSCDPRGLKAPGWFQPLNL
jgi:hypothetical protein